RAQNPLWFALASAFKAAISSALRRARAVNPEAGGKRRSSTRTDSIFWLVTAPECKPKCPLDSLNDFSRTWETTYAYRTPVGPAGTGPVRRDGPDDGSRRRLPSQGRSRRRRGRQGRREGGDPRRCRRLEGRRSH